MKALTMIDQVRKMDSWSDEKLIAHRETLTGWLEGKIDSVKTHYYFQRLESIAREIEYRKKNAMVI